MLVTGQCEQGFPTNPTFCSKTGVYSGNSYIFLNLFLNIEYGFMLERLDEAVLMIIDNLYFENKKT